MGSHEQSWAVMGSHGQPWAVMGSHRQLVITSLVNSFFV